MNGRDREFFWKIKEAAFANPFGPQRLSVDLEITGMDRSSSSEAILARLMEEVQHRLSGYQQTPGKLSAEDRRLMRFGVLFYVFHLFCDDYDQLITDQVKAGDESISVSFSKDVLKLLGEYGLSPKEALRFFSLFFQLRRGFYFISGIIGQSQSVAKLRQALWNNIFTYDISLYENHLWNRMEDFSTIILGKTGTGKGMAAAAIGRSGYISFLERKNRFAESFARTFLSINLSQFSADLIESELFGHAKGAFTGAIDNYKGVFSRCSAHGAIFLDEIGEVSLPLQIKLLQVLQERTFSPVGSHSVEKFNGRVIAATNQPLLQLRKEKKFRDDFYYRLCSDTIEVPSLRQRLAEHPAELKIILAATLKRILGYESKPLTRDIEKAIRDSIPPGYGWPGNIRELEQCVRQMLLNRSYNWHQDPDLTESFSEFQSKFLKGEYSATNLLALYCSQLYSRYGTYEKVAQKTGLDRRTVKKYVEVSAGHELC